ncbi:MAG: ABC transporter ATP-binding protein [Planctomycetes bacterium]|nr:ABC transporter ATP-binding protein [Planctomycetota bacterium]
MRRKLQLVRALVHEPPVLVLDEPTSGLDPAVVEEVWEILKALSRDRGVAILFSSHQLDEVERLCDRVSVIKGRLLAEGTLAELSGASGARRVLLEGEASPFAAAVAEAGGVAGMEAKGRELRFRVADPAGPSPVPAVVAKLAAAGARILEVGPVETDLRALYRSIVGEASAPGGPR